MSLAPPCCWPPLAEQRNMAPLAAGPTPSEVRIMASANGMGGGGVVLFSFDWARPAGLEWSAVAWGCQLSSRLPAPSSRPSPLLNALQTAAALSPRRHINPQCRYIAEALGYNDSLAQLNLRYNRIGDDGARYLAQALLKNKGLKMLYLSCNNITAEGVYLLAQSLQHNTVLEHLDLYGNDIDSSGVQSLAAALESNMTLKQLDLPQMEPLIRPLLLRNRQAQGYLRFFPGCSPELNPLGSTPSCAASATSVCGLGLVSIHLGARNLNFLTEYGGLTEGT